MKKIKFLLPLIGLAVISLCLMNPNTLSSLVRKSTNNGKGEQSFVTASADIKQQVLEAYGNIPLSFELNQGQTSEEVKFLSRANGYKLFLTGNERGFEIERCSNAGCASFVQITIVGAGVQGFINTGLSADTTYSYRVRAFNNYGSSNYTNIAEATTLGSSSPADSVAVQKADYTTSKKSLQVEATGSNASAVLKVYVTSTGAYIGTLGNSGRGRYKGNFAWSVNPQNITVKSSLGGSAARTVITR